MYAVFGAPYYGGANGHDYFNGRIAATFKADPKNVAIKNAKGGYTIVATSGEKYDFFPGGTT